MTAHAPEPAPGATPHVDVRRLLDEQPLGPAHYLILVLCALVLFIDAFDVYVVGKVAPAIAAGFHAPSKAMTSVFLLQQIGLAVGAFGAAPLADRFGRKRMIVVCAGTFGVLTLLSPLARSLGELAVLRGIAGVFLSSLMPMVVALLSEATPRIRRGAFVAGAMAGYTAGAAAGGIVAAWLIDRWGWQAAFWIGGGLPLVLLPALLVGLTESPEYLALKSHDPARVRAALARIAPGALVPATAAFRAAAPEAKVPVAELLARSRRTATLCLWAACFFSMGTIALLAAWLPTFFLEMRGVPIQRFAVYALIGYAGSLAGILVAGSLMDRWPAHRLVPAMFAGLAASLAALGVVPFGVPVFIGVLIAYNFFQSAGQAVLNLQLARLYPARMRSTGIGWAGGLGRIGGIVAPALGGVALHAHLSLPATMALSALLPLAVSVVLWRMPEIPREA